MLLTEHSFLTPECMRFPLLLFGDMLELYSAIIASQSSRVGLESSCRFTSAGISSGAGLDYAALCGAYIFETASRYTMIFECVLNISKQRCMALRLSTKAPLLGITLNISMFKSVHGNMKKVYVVKNSNIQTSI
jgi:hypothetical protein